MPSGYRFSRAVRREFFDRVCRGQSVREAAAGSGVFYNTAWVWWRDAGAMNLGRNSKGALGLVEPGDLDRPGGRGHRLSLDERIEIMRGLDAGLTPAAIGRKIDRHRSVVGREIERNSNPTLNRRPRPTLAFDTPAERLAKLH